VIDMPRVNWKGVISFGLVTIPEKSLANKKSKKRGGRLKKSG